jgi:Dipeptidyl aminopeptidases/acylaminoacyl-peptidases
MRGHVGRATGRWNPLSGPRSSLTKMTIARHRFAAQDDSPILLIQGRDDTVVPFEQSAKMADALKDAGKPFRRVD